MSGGDHDRMAFGPRDVLAEMPEEGDTKVDRGVRPVLDLALRMSELASDVEDYGLSLSASLRVHRRLRRKSQHPELYVGWANLATPLAGYQAMAPNGAQSKDDK